MPALPAASIAGLPAPPAAAMAQPAEPPPELPPELRDDGSDDVPELEPAASAPSAAPSAPPSVTVSAPPPKPVLASLARETWVYAEPKTSARKLGYLRTGAVVERRATPLKGGGGACAGAWYRVEPRGYVCVGGTGATLDPYDATVSAASRRPDVDPTHGGLPYSYVLSRHPAPILYTKLPTEEEQRERETDLAKHLRSFSQLSRDASFVPFPEADPIPAQLLYGQPAPKLGGGRWSERQTSIGHAKARSGFALLSTFDSEGRRFGLTTDLLVLPLDRVRVVKPSSFHGLELTGEVQLPVVFVKRKHAVRYVREGAAVRAGETLAFREAVPVEDREERLHGVGYQVAKDGTLLRTEDVVRIDKPTRMPGWAAGDRTWIDVSILKQSLVAWQGATPRYVTLVSTGADGLGDPEKTHSTVQGIFLVHTKHVTVTMDGDEKTDEFDFRDVPFVQYFQNGYALHAAYWHDDFGTPRSHGCVNLAPRDAAWLFGFSEPKVPSGWHAALSLRRGTLIYTHP